MAESDCFCPRKIQNQNAAFRIRHREIFGCRPKMNTIRERDKFYTNILPNLSVSNIEKEPGCLRKFSPDGNYLISIDPGFNSITIYRYRGIERGLHTIHSYMNNNLHRSSTNFKIDQSACTQRLFSDVFLKLYNVLVVHDNDDYLSRDVTIFTSDSRFLILISERYLNSPDEFETLTYSETHANNESLSSPATLRGAVSNYTVHCVDLTYGIVTDSKPIKCDKIQLYQVHGLSLAERSLAILGHQKQEVHLFQIGDNGELFPTNRLGRFLYEDDEMTIANGQLSDQQAPQHACFDRVYCTMKQRLLAFLFRRAYTEGVVALKRFYFCFPLFESLRMYRVQWLDPQHLLIRFASDQAMQNVVSQPMAARPSPDSLTMTPCLFAVYGVDSTEIVALYENVDAGFLRLYESFAEFFRHYHAPHRSAVSNSVYVRDAHEKQKAALISARNGGHIEAIKRLLAKMPSGCQASNLSPYVDPQLFSFDEKMTGGEKSKHVVAAAADTPVKFFARDSGLLKFKMQVIPSDASAELLGEADRSRRPPATYIFHPRDPLVISLVQHAMAAHRGVTAVTFHMRCADAAPDEAVDFVAG